MSIWIKILIFLTAWIILFSLLAFFMSIHPKKIRTEIYPSDLGLKYEDVNFKSSDGIWLRGWFIPNNKTKAAIIVMHGYPADKSNLLGIASFLAKDFNVFLFDFRSFGKSEGSYTTAGYLEKNDLLGAINYLEKEKNIARIGLYGFSMGGSVALMANHKNVKAIVADSAYAKLSHIVEHMYGTFYVLKYPLTYLTKLYGKIFLGLNLDEVSPLDNMKYLKIPILIIHAEKDSQIPVEESYLLNDANKESELWVVKDAEHGMTHSINPKKYEDKVIGFFKDRVP